jgi:hypothetical protein
VHFGRVSSIDASSRSDNEHDNKATLANARAEAKQIELQSQRREQVRHLFFEQAKLNRVKVRRKVTVTVTGK